MAKPLSLERLIGMGCHSCDDDGNGEQPMFFHGRCHVGAPTQVAVEHNRLAVTCSECDKLIAEIWVDAPVKRSIVVCPHVKHKTQLFTTLYFESDVMVMCPRCDKTAALFSVLTGEEAERRQKTN